MTLPPSERRLLPPLVMLRAFEAAGRTGSMRRAAADISITHTVVSRHVRNLELWLGVKLVLAGSRGVDLTAEGEVLLASVGRAFDLIASTTTQLRPTRQRGLLRIWCIPGLATRWLTPRLSSLEQVLDGVEIELRATEAKPHFDRGEADVLIGFNVLQRLPDTAVELLRPRMFPVASPGWLVRNGHPETIAHLARSSLIHEGNHLQWTTWLEAVGHPPPYALRGPRLSDASIGYDAAMSDQGIALLNELMVIEELASGSLVELFDTDVKLGTYYLLAAPRRRRDPIIETFTAWLAANVRASVPGA